jgi:cytochrome c
MTNIESEVNLVKRQIFKGGFVVYGVLSAMFVVGGSLLINAEAVQPTSGTKIRISGDAVHGKVLYQGCAACHSIDENDIGPKHRGVFGRHAGSIPDYPYSAALKNSGFIWDESLLDRWLTNPSALVPGTKMFFKLDDAQSRADIIAYLKEQK